MVSEELTPASAAATIYAIDPGVHHIGFARFDHREFWHVSLTATHPALPTGDPYAWVICEVPEIYPSRAMRGDPNDLINVALAAGAAVGQLRPSGVTWVRPKEWKGQAPKDVTAARVWALLNRDETRRLKACLESVAPSLQHNVIDAVAIGLWALRRRYQGKAMEL